MRQRPRRARRAGGAPPRARRGRPVVASSGAARTRKSSASSLVRATNQPRPVARLRWSTLYSMPSRRADEDPGPCQGLVGRDGPPLGRVGAVQSDQDEGLVAGRADAQGEAAVWLFEDDDVGPRVASQAVAPQLERAQRLVQADVEDVIGPGRPGQPVPGLRHDLGRRRERGLGVERREAQLVLLVPGSVGRVGQPVVVMAHRGAAHGEVVRAGGQRVLVEEHLLLLAGLAGRGSSPLRRAGRRQWMP